MKILVTAAMMAAEPAAKTASKMDGSSPGYAGT
jgi:hypothetical protein